MDNRVFMDLTDDDFFREKEFDVNNFINDIGDIDDVTAFNILDKIRLVNSNNRKILLSNDVIRNKLRYGLLKESSDNQWYYYREILKVITPKEFISLYDARYLNDYFVHTEKGEEKYRFYAALCEKNVNEVVSYVLCDREMYEDFFGCCNAFSSLFSELSYDLIKAVILKKQNEGYKLSNRFFCDISDECQSTIVKDNEINNDTLIFILPMLSNKNLSNFFENDSRALYLYNKFNIDSLIERNIKFNDNILKKNEFFDMIKKNSFIEFRRIINRIEKINNPVIIEDKLEGYYNEIISQYDRDSGMFRDYQIILNNPGMYKMKNSYIFDFDIVDKFSNSLRENTDNSYYYNDIEELNNFLKVATSKKLSEVIIDALFGDNIYNVWLNIKEMLRYNDMLESDNKVLDNGQVNYYRMILNFDNVDNIQKIDLYNRFKDKNLSLVFYEDLRRIKDVCYDRIKLNLINPCLYSSYIDISSSDRYGVEVYDLRDKEYTMLVRTQDDYREVTHYRRGCYSIISNENTQVFGEYDYSSFLYGYNSFDNDMVLHMFESDSYSTNFKDESSRYVNRIMTSEELVKVNPSYSEIQILNEKSEIGKYRWTAKRPDFIVVFNTIGDRHVNESKRLGIPIVVISKRKLNKDDVIDLDLDKDGNAYVNNVFDENEHRIKR